MENLIAAVERYREAAGVPAGSVDAAAIAGHAPGDGAAGDRAVAAAAARAVLRLVPAHQPPGRTRRAHPACRAMPVMLAARAEGVLDAAEQQWVDAQARHCVGCGQLLALAERARRAFESGLGTESAEAHPWLPAGVVSAPPAADGDEPANAWLPRTS